MEVGMDYIALRDELDSDPLGRGYEELPTPMSDEEVAADMNAVYRTRNRTSMTASEVFNACDETEFDALSPEEEALVWNILHLGALNPFGLEAIKFQAIFGASTTITTLQSLRVEDVSRAVELGLGRVSTGDVQKARAL
jgi:hypothetical protein